MSLILLVDDESEALLSLSRALKVKDNSLTFEVAVNADKALALAAEKSFDLTIIDLNLDPAKGVESGFSLLEKLLAMDSGLKIIVLTGNSSIENGVRALRMGASHFLEKPPDISHLLALIKDCARQREIFRMYSDSSKKGQDFIIDGKLLGNSQTLLKLKEELKFAASTNQPVLLIGETGTGKTLCASLLHSLSSRASRKFVTYTSAYLNADLVSSELFGHLKGSFTGANDQRLGLLKEADGGTFFVDEVDEIPQDVQVSLLKTLQNKTFRMLGSNKEEHSDFRFISASNRSEAELTDSKKLRADFFHRIAHHIIRLPALRERVSDIEEIALGILSNISSAEGLKVYSLTEEAKNKLLTYAWPGNVRELESVIINAAYRARFLEKNIIDEDEIVIRGQVGVTVSHNFHELVESYKIKLVEQALGQSGNNQVQAAKLLGLDRSSLRRILSRS